MIPLIEQNREKIVALCKKHGVKRLELFGSAAREDDFDPATSDVDFLYVIDEHQDRLADRFFDFLAELEDMFGKKVDLVSLLDMKNPYFIQVVNRSRALLYAA